MLGGGVLDAVAGELEVGGLERGCDRGQLVEAEPVSGGDVADRVRREAVDLKPAGSVDVRVTPSAASKGASAPASGEATTTPPPVECSMKSSIEVSARMRPWPMISR